MKNIIHETKNLTCRLLINNKKSHDHERLIIIVNNVYFLNRKIIFMFVEIRRIKKS